MLCRHLKNQYELIPTMKISIVTAVRNGAVTIADTVESINIQSWPHLEHVVVDACSTDSTVDVIRSLARRPTSIVSERDSGVYDAFNKGVLRASGELIAFLNADDFYVGPNVIADVVKRITEADADVVYGDVQLVAPKNTSRVVRRYDSGAFRVSRLRMGFMPAHPATFIRRRLFERIGYFDPSYRIAGDFEFTARAFGRYGATHVYLPATLTTMRTGGLSTSGLGAKWKISQEIVRACRANGIRTNYGWAALRFLLKAHELLP
jgi:glycosyltransferase involved in cell wall biosynthesis